MKAFDSSSRYRVCRTFAALAILLSWQGTAAAASGTWTESTGDGAWSSGANWSGGTVADGAGNTADFSMIDLDAVSVSTNYPSFFRNAVQLDASRTIGNLVFGDANLASGGAWEVYPNAGTEILTLEGASPTITVNPFTPFDTGLEIIDDAVIRPVITGTNGLTKAGDGILTLNSGGSFNLLTGGININAGTLRINSVINGQAINIANGATLSTNQELRNVVVGPAAHTINVASGATANIIANSNVGNVAAAGATLNLSVPNAGETFSANDSWAVNGSISRLNVSSANGGFFRLRINGGAFDGNSFANTHVDLDNITTWTRTNSGGNTVNIGAL